MNKKKKKYLIDKIILIFAILLLLIQISNFFFFNSIDTFYFKYLFDNWSKQLNFNLCCQNCKKENNSNFYSYLNDDEYKCENYSINLFANRFIINETDDVYDFFNLTSPNKIKNMNKNSSFNITQVNGSKIFSSRDRDNNNYLSIFGSLSNDSSNKIIIDSLNNSKKNLNELSKQDLNKFIYYSNPNGFHFYFSSYIFSIHKPYLDPKCNKFNNINNTCKNNAPDHNSFKILSMNLSSFIKENNNSTDYNGNEKILLYGKMYYGLNKSNPNCSFNKNFDIIKEENDLLILNIINGKKWLMFGLIIHVILILLYLEKFIVSYIKINNGKETLPNYVKPLLMVVSIIEFIICAMIFSLITFHPDIMDDLYEKENCLDKSIDQFIKPYIKNYKICEKMNIISLIISFFIGIYLGIRRAVKYAN